MPRKKEKAKEPRARKKTRVPKAMEYLEVMESSIAIEQPENIEVPKEIKTSTKLWRYYGLTFIFVIVIFCAWSFFQYRKARSEAQRLSSVQGRQELVQKETQDLLEKVKKFIILPEDESPIVATISDPDKLSADQPFYKGAMKGDKVIIYPKAQKAIIFSPERNVLVNVGPADVQSPTQDENGK